MKFRSVMLRYEEADSLWRIYWSDTMTLADERWFPTLEGASVVFRALISRMDDTRPDQS